MYDPATYLRIAIAKLNALAALIELHAADEEPRSGYEEQMRLQYQVARLRETAAAAEIVHAGAMQTGKDEDMLSLAVEIEGRLERVEWLDTWVPALVGYRTLIQMAPDELWEIHEPPPGSE